MSQVDLFDHFTTKPKTLTWVIENFENASNCYSPRITNTDLNLFLRPNEDVPGLGNKQVVIYLSANSSEHFPTFYYRISSINDIGLKRNTQEGRTNSFGYYANGIHGRYLITRDYLLDKANGLLPDRKLTIYCEVFELDDACVKSGVNKDNLVSLSQDNQSLLDSGKLSDVVLVVGEREFKAHKVILSARSEVFEKMFEHDLEESEHNRVEIEDMSAGAAEELLNFIYTGKVWDMEQHVYELYASADKYQIDSLKSYCGLYLAMSLSVSTVLKTLRLADLHSLEDLKSKCTEYITRNSAEFEYDDWKELSTSRPELMYQVFKILGNKLK